MRASARSCFLALRGRACPLLAFVWPLLYLWRRCIPIGGSYVGVSNDFEYLYYNTKLYLLDRLSHFALPWWSPSEAAGFPFFSNPFTQTFYPFNAPLALFYRLAGGYTRLDHQIFTVLGICLFSLGLHLWLRALGFNARVACVAGLVLSVSFKVTELVRFPNAVHTAAWYPWILFALTRIALCGRHPLRSCALLFAVTVCFLTGGYPYFVYYGQFLIPPYLALLFAPRSRRWLFPAAEPTNPWKRFAAIAAAGGAALAVCAPYLLHVKRLLDATQDRDGKNLAYSRQFGFGAGDTVGSLFFPPAATAEGWYYFGILPLLVIGLYVFRAGRRRDRGDLVHAGVLLGWVAVVSAISYSRGSWLFDWMWSHWPGFSGLRAWGRINILLVPLFAWLFACAFGRLEEDLTAVAETRRLPRDRVLFVALLSACILSLQALLLVRGSFQKYWFFLASGGVACLTLCAAFAWASAKGGASRLLPALAASCVLVSAVDMYPVGALVWSEAGRVAPRRPLDVARLNLQSLSRPRININGGIRLDDRFNVGVVANWYFARYVGFLARARTEERAVGDLLGLRDGRRIYSTERIDHKSVAAFLADARGRPQTARVEHYDGDSLRLQLPPGFGGGWISFIDNWDPAWEAAVDGAQVPLDRLFGAFKAVRVGAGSRRVEFRYRPQLLAAPAPPRT